MTTPMDARWAWEERPRLLLVGDATDLPAIRRELAAAAEHTYGHVFIEVAADVQIVELSRPADVRLTWLRRHRSSASESGFASRGELAARALAAWCAEWMPEHPDADGARFRIWVGCATSPRVSRIFRALRARFPQESGGVPDVADGIRDERTGKDVRSSWPVDEGAIDVD